MDITGPLTGGLLGSLAGLLPGLHANALVWIAFVVMNGASDQSAFLISLGLSQATTTILGNILSAGRDSDLRPVAQRFLERARARDAILLHSLGALSGTIASFALFFLFADWIRRIEPLLSLLIPIILFLALASIVLKGTSPTHRIRTIAILLLAGAMGHVFLAPRAFDHVLLALMTGYFAFSAILQSVFHPLNARLEPQKKPRHVPLRALASSARGIIGGLVVGSIPAMTAHQSLSLFDRLLSKQKPRAYLISIGALETTSIMASIAVLMALQQSRTGIAVAIAETQWALSTHALGLCAAGLMGLSIGLFVNRLASAFLSQRNWNPHDSKLSLVLGAGLLFLVLSLQPLNIVPLVAATSLGLACEYWNVPKTACMAFLSIPTLAFYLGT